MKKTLIALAMIAHSAGSFADWTPVDKTDDDGYYSYTESTRFGNSLLGIYAYPEPDAGSCKPFLMLLSTHDSEAVEGSVDVGLRARIDSGKVHRGTGKIFFTPDTDGTSTQRILVPVADSIVMELVSGRKLIIDDLVDDGPGADGMKTDEFSLMGFGLAHLQTVEACEAAEGDEWGVKPGEWSL
jgi:hypothetical protein